MDFVVDSSFIVDVLRGQKRAVALGGMLEKEGASIGVPAIVLHEVRTGLLHRTSRAQAARFGEMLERFPILAFDASAAHRSAEIQAEALGLGRAYAEMDVMIAATALVHGARLVTNDRAFQDVSEAFGLRLRPY